MDIPWLHNLSKAAFIESNPIPIKYMLAKQGMCKEIYRMPLCEMSIPHKEFVNQVMKEQNL
jgi:4-hydroxy-tetrahydrodipicolinate synthase